MALRFILNETAYFGKNARDVLPEEIIKRASSLISKPDTDIEELMKNIYDTKKQIENE